MGGSAHSPPTHGTAVERTGLRGLPIDSTQGENGAGTEGRAKTLQNDTAGRQRGWCSAAAATAAAARQSKSNKQSEVREELTKGDREGLNQVLLSPTIGQTSQTKRHGNSVYAT